MASKSAVEIRWYFWCCISDARKTVKLTLSYVKQLLSCQNQSWCGSTRILRWSNRISRICTTHFDVWFRYFLACKLFKEFPIFFRSPRRLIIYRPVIFFPPSALSGANQVARLIMSRTKLDSPLASWHFLKINLAFTGSLLHVWRRRPKMGSVISKPIFRFYSPFSSISPLLRVSYEIYFELIWVEFGQIVRNKNCAPREIDNRVVQRHLNDYSFLREIYSLAMIHRFFGN